ncbi:hypothetical protein I5Q34_02345 [Streptomyces sp. AV19]|uniref:hypothetical protein n=1 Tax=Streptomyces sp. AV19 TaxID=2793068 RepID=UPI0018FE4E9D|nr:hypothetical protein [Streptomyces sp. AV19]MBH1933138.1 hypothetical protein [Streptomyces sp. AV19]MDG4531852.1 hypothetical protein [Streptomyces sp. AV19]
MEAAAVIIALIFAVLVALGVVATVKAVKAVKRGVDRTVTEARRTVEDTRLKARRYVQPGAGGEVAQLRLSLRTTMRATQDALRLGVREDPSLSESLALFERLSAHGRELDEELRRLETEPSAERVRESLPALRERTERIRHSADSLRWAAQDRARRFSDDDLADLDEQIRMEAGALRHWMPVDAEEPGASGTSGVSGASEVSGNARASGAPASSGPSTPSPAPGAERPSIAGRQPWQEGDRPWESGRLQGKWQKKSAS